MIIFESINIVFCFISSYHYIWLAVFVESVHDSDQINMFFEIFFSLSIFFRFFTDYTEEGETLPERNLNIISKRYFYSWSFLIDLIPLIPFILFFGHESKNAKLFYVVKIVRMLKGLKVFNVQLIFE